MPDDVALPDGWPLPRVGDHMEIDARDVVVTCVWHVVADGYVVVEVELADWER